MYSKSLKPFHYYLTQLFHSGPRFCRVFDAIDVEGTIVRALMVLMCGH